MTKIIIHNAKRDIMKSYQVYKAFLSVYSSDTYLDKPVPLVNICFRPYESMAAPQLDGGRLRSVLHCSLAYLTGL